MNRSQLLHKFAAARFTDWKETTELTPHLEKAILHSVGEVIKNPTLGVYSTVPNNVYSNIYNLLVELEMIQPIEVPKGFPLYKLLVDGTP